MDNSTKNKKSKFAVNSSILILLILGIVILLNILLNRYSYKKEITQQKYFELSEQTLQTLTSLDKSRKKVDIYLFVPSQEYLDIKTKNLIIGLLEKYDKKSENLSVKSIDVDKNPTLAKKYSAGPYDIVFDREGRTRTLSLMDMFDGMAFNGESAYTSAINYVLNENPPVIYFIQGHKEADLDKDITYLKSQIDRDGYIIKTINLTLEGKVPEDASMIVDVGAKTEFSGNELNILKNYLNNGGKAVFLLSEYNDSNSITSLKNLLSEYGLDVGDNIVFDPLRRAEMDTPNIIVPIYESNEIVKKLDEQSQFYMAIPNSRSVQIRQIEGQDSEPLLTTTNSAWGESSLEQYNTGSVAFDNNDSAGPIAIGGYVKKTINDKEMELVVVGNELFVYDIVFAQTRSVANIEFVQNTLSKLSPQEQPVTIKAKPIDIKYLSLPANKKNVLFVFLVIIIPIACIITGLVIWMKRRNL